MTIVPHPFNNVLQGPPGQTIKSLPNLPRPLPLHTFDR